MLSHTSPALYVQRIIDRGTIVGCINASVLSNSLAPGARARTGIRTTSRHLLNLQLIPYRREGNLPWRRLSAPPDIAQDIGHWGLANIL